MIDSHLILLKKTPLFSTLDIESIRLIKSGLSNHNYHVHHHNKDYFVKIPSKGSSYLLNPARACQHTQHAVDLGITPAIIHFDPTSNILIQDYIVNQPTLPPTLEQCATVLKTLHTANTLFSESIDYFQQLDDYLTKLIAIPDHFVPIIKQVQHLAQYINQKTQQRVPCHNDPVLDNFITDKKKVVLVDWEYSANGDPAWDLAYFITYNQLSSQQQQTFLAAYQHQDQTLLSRMAHYKPLTTLMFVILIELWIQDNWLPTDKNSLLTWQADYLQKTQDLLDESC